MASPKVSKDKFFEKVINPYLTGVLQHPLSIEMHEGVLHIHDVEGPKKTGSMEARLEAMEQQVFKCQGMVERGLNANHMMITEFTNKHKINANDIGKHLSRLCDRIDHLQAQMYDLQNQNCLLGYFIESQTAKVAKQSGIEISVTCYPICRSFGYRYLSGLKERILDDDYMELDDDLCRDLTECADSDRVVVKKNFVML
ncbi:40S ribosomal protein S5-1 [Hordeum vulgare]|nr:40S ribosomal protein S5-1 [Hordeum vulgare]